MLVPRPTQPAHPTVGHEEPQTKRNDDDLVVAWRQQIQNEHHRQLLKPSAPDTNYRRTTPIPRLAKNQNHET
eukprot:847645-Rhodomonas_salina.1